MPLDSQEQVELFKEYLETLYKEDIANLSKSSKKFLLVDFSKLAELNFELAEQILDDPTETLENLEIALFQINEELPKDTRIRIRDLPKSQLIKLRDIRHVNLGTLFSVEGIIRQASEIRPRVVSAKFECPTCGTIHSILQIDQAFKEPVRCSCGRKGKFRLVSRKLVDAQRVILEEAPEALEGGEHPKRLAIFLKEDLVEPKMEKKTTPGSKVRIIGILKEVPIPLRTGGQSTQFDLAIEANYIEPIQESFDELDVTKEEELEIKRLAKDPKVFDKIISSVAPSIFGHNEIKASLILQLLGGSRKVTEDGVARRGDIHILLVGDPGVAKSQLLQFIIKIAPKGRFVTGKGASGAGLTAAVVRDEFLKGWALEAGAMALANKGVCAIDELDKMTPEDRSALHEALEQQTISISKANIQATLNAQTTVLAAANPKLGRFDPYSPIASQVDLPPSLINRFDLIFPIRDLPSRETDEKIAHHVLSIYQNPERLETPLNQEFIRKYISYAKQRIKPILTNEAIDEIKTFYVNLRNSATSSDDEVKPIPISARQLEALVRLSEASAKVRLSQKVTKEDAKRAIILLQSCLMQVGFDKETGQIDIDRISSGITAAKRSKINLVKDIISSLEEKGLKTIPIEEITALAVEKGLQENVVEEVLDGLKRVGDIFEPKRGFIQKIK